MRCCQTLPISLLLFKYLLPYDIFTSMQVMQVLIHSCIDLPTLSCVDSSTYSKDCFHSFIHPVFYPFIHPFDSDFHCCIHLSILPYMYALIHLFRCQIMHPIFLLICVHPFIHAHAFIRSSIDLWIHRHIHSFIHLVALAHPSLIPHVSKRSVGCRPTWHEQDTLQGCKSARSVLQSRHRHLQQVLGPYLSSQHVGSHVNDDQPISRLHNMPPCTFTHAQISHHL